MLQERRRSRRANRRELAALHKALSATRPPSPRASPDDADDSNNACVVKGKGSDVDIRDDDDTGKAETKGRPAVVTVSMMDFNGLGSSDSVAVGGCRAKDMAMRSSPEPGGVPQVKVERDHYDFRDGGNGGDIATHGSRYDASGGGVEDNQKVLVHARLRGCCEKEARQDMSATPAMDVVRIDAVTGSDTCADVMEKESSPSQTDLLVQMGLVRARVNGGGVAEDLEGGFRPVAENLWREVEEIKESLGEVQR